MIVTSPAWEETLATSHTMLASVLVDGVERRVTSGNVVLDLDNESYGSLVFTLADEEDVGLDEGDPVLPFGQRAVVRYFLRTPSGVEAVEITCEFLLTSAPTRAGVLTAREVRAATTVLLVKDDRFLVPWQPPTTSARDSLTGLLQASVPGAVVTYDATVTDRTVHTTTIYERERWEAVAALLDSLDSYLRPVPGGFRVSPLVQTAGTSVWRVATGENLLHGTKPGASRDGRYNAVVAFNADDPTVWAVAYQTVGPTRWNGPFGHRPAFYASPFLTAATVQQAANTRLGSINGRARVLEVECIRNPALEPGDFVDVIWPGGTSEQIMIRKIEMPLEPGSMRITGQAAAAV